ncbi:MAG: hypothetical protein HY308_17880 [Gammaproteobacteria bacterium]|nr:hypothetical protein [Gammaproteobacteria bacterium]
MTPLQGTVAASHNWRLLGLFNIYRVCIAVTTLAISLTLGQLPPFGADNPALFRIAGIVYFVISITAVEAARWRKPDFDTQISVWTFADITLLALLMHSSGGISSGLGLLLIVASAGSSLMLGRRVSIFYASLATVAAMLEHSWDLLIGGTVTENLVGGYPQVGLLGIGLFTTTFLSYTLGSRLRATEVIAARRGVDIANLTHINELIIQRMQSGVLACNHTGSIMFMNQTAQRFLGLREPPLDKKMSLNEISSDLAIQLFQWLGDTPGQRTRRAFTTRANYTLLPRFVPLGAAKESGTLVFLEDMAALKQQAQQLKMAALARLTASIAHEIRNPLSAISNAAQLLGESVGEDSEPKRLTTIIEEQGRRMNVIIQNVTQLSRRDRVNQARLALQTWLADFLTQYVDAVRIPLPAFTRLGDDVEALFDPDQLNQVITNLCQNALRHSPPFSGTALIKLATGNDGDGRPYFDVIDWGSGVPANIADNIFDPFFTTTPKGTGLGLYIAKELCEGNGALLDYHPGEGGVGSRFRVTLARAEENNELGAV